MRNAGVHKKQHTHTHSCDIRDLSTYTGDSERAKTHGLLLEQREIPLTLFLNREEQELALAENKIPDKYHSFLCAHTDTLSGLK